MSGSEKAHSGLTRRNFLKATGMFGAGAVGVGAAGTFLRKTAASGDPQARNVFYGQCRGNCTGGCRIKVQVEDGKLVHAEMAPSKLERFNRICSKGLSHVQRAYSPRRVMYPMRRAGGRGEGKWERISWDEALAEIAGRWKEYQEEYGRSSIFISGGSGNQGKAIGIYPMLQSLLGASSIVYSCDSAGLSMAYKTLGMGEFFNSNSPLSDAEAKTILIMGANATDSMVNSFHFLEDAKEAGATLIHIDPNFNMTSARSTQHIPIRPGSDGALLLAMVNVCIRNGWTNDEFLKKATVAPYLVKEDGSFLRASDLGVEPVEGPTDPLTGLASAVDPVQVWDEAVNGIGDADDVVAPALDCELSTEVGVVKTAYRLLVESVEEWTPERAQELTEIKKEEIELLAKKFALEGPSLLYMGYGIDHYCGGHQVYHAAVELLAVTGMVGKVGTGLAGCFCANVPFFLNNPHTIVADAVVGPAVSYVNLPQTLETGCIGDTPVTPKAMLCYAANPVSNITDRQRVLADFQAFDHVVVVDWALTETAQWADIVLPACGWFECEDIGTGGSTSNVNLQEKAIDPIGESKTDYEICQLIAEAMGLNGKIPWSYDEYLEGYFDNDLARSKGLSMDRLREEKTILAHEDGSYIHGQDGVFPTETSKVNFYLESFNRSAMFEGMEAGQSVSLELEHLAHFEPPHEAWTESVGGFERSDASRDFPLIFMSYRNRYRTHTQFFDCDWLNEIDPEPTLRMNPVDAGARGIVEGDYARAYNDRGEVILKVQMHNGVRPGVVVYPKGFQSFEYVKGHCSDLTSRYTHPALYNNYFFDVVCEVEKYEVV